MKKTYITPKVEIVSTFSETICQIITGSDGHKKDSGGFTSDESIGYGGESDGDDFAKNYNAWSTWDE